MNSQTILFYGSADSQKSSFVKHLKGTENSVVPKNPYTFPTIYVTTILPDDTSKFNIILHFTSDNEVIFEKGIINHSI